MDRRIFLKFFGTNLIALYGSMLWPLKVCSETGFDYALDGQGFIQKKEFAKAVNALKKAVEIEPDNDWAFGLLGRAYMGLSRNAEAVAAFRKAVQINSDDTYSRMMVEILTQKPIKVLKKKERPLTELEQKAFQEEAAMGDKMQGERGLGYKVNRVVIDAGHGGFDPGAVGKKGLKEKDVNLDVALRLQKKLASMGRIKSFLTRTGDYYIPLSDRTVTANQYRADLFISIHANASTRREANGSETYFCSEKASSAEAAKVAAFENSVIKFDKPYKKKAGFIDIEEILFNLEQKLNWKESGRFANLFQNRFKEKLPLKSRGVHSANFYVLRRSKMPSILLETGFISNPAEEALLKQPGFRDRIAEAVARGLS